MESSVLLIAYHFPPAAMGSGHLRTLGFSRYLPASGWHPVVLSAHPMAYPQTAPVDEALLPPGCPIHRALAFDARRHFGIAGKYPGFLAQPDRWRSWWPAAVLQGLRLIRRHGVRAIWSTYPIMTAHCIAHTLQHMTGLPWIADFRDPVSSSVSSANPFSVASQLRWERRVMERASRVVFTTPGAMRACARHFPQLDAQGRLAVIGNGYDETAFTDLPAPVPIHEHRPLVLLHSGLLYPEGRNPLPFFKALARLKGAHQVNATDLRIVLRASGSNATYSNDIRRLGLDDMVTLAPPVSNREALAEQARADALLLFQGERFDRQIPAKVYEYLRIDRPIFALVGEHGDTAALLRETGGAELVTPDDVGAMASRLASFIGALRSGQAPQARRDVVARHARSEGAASLARLLDQVSAHEPRRASR
ncbi:MAG TPA: glycosyltransferase [Oleiagrimonas sp.]|nr:glycosyltransferase [Oleiagrimonas sp.]